MLTVEIQTWDGEVYALPILLQWDITCTASVPCDSFTAMCLYSRDMGEVLPRATRFTAYQDGEILLKGVVDAYEISLSSQGLTAILEGRGMAALLLDNEAEAVTYGKATLSEVVRNHVAPYGISVSQNHALREIPYVVPSGTSQWRALRGFTHRAGGFDPYFTREGDLVIGPLWGSGDTKSYSDETPILSLRKREQRFGVISEVLILDKRQGIRHCIENQPFKDQGGSRRHVLYMPRSTLDQRRYTGSYQIQESAKDQLELTLEFSTAFAAFPGDTVELQLSRLGLSGSFDVAACRSRMTEAGERCEVTLCTRRSMYVDI